MDWWRYFRKSLFNAFEKSGRARALSVLRGMDTRTLQDLGYSPMLLRKGLSAWPWRMERPEQAASPPSETALRQAKAELEAYSVGATVDVGLRRGHAASVVHQGRPNVDDVAA